MTTNQTKVNKKPQRKLTIIILVMLFLGLISYFVITGIHFKQDINVIKQDINVIKQEDDDRKESNKKDESLNKENESLNKENESLNKENESTQTNNSSKETTIIYDISGTQASLVKSVIRTRLDTMGYYEVKITTKKNKLEVVLPKQDNIRELSEALIKEADIKFIDYNNNVLLTHKDIESVRTIEDKQNNSSYCVELEFTIEGREKFKRATADISQMPVGNNYIAILLDDTLISTPSVSEEIDSKVCVIYGDFTKQEAQRLEAMIKFPLIKTSVGIVEIR